jgi:hypothetical protein
MTFYLGNPMDCSNKKYLDVKLSTEWCLGNGKYFFIAITHPSTNIAQRRLTLWSWGNSPADDYSFINVASAEKFHRNCSIENWHTWSSIGILHIVLCNFTELLWSSIKLHEEFLWNSVEILWSSIWKFSMEKILWRFLWIFPLGT